MIIFVSLASVCSRKHNGIKCLEGSRKIKMCGLVPLVHILWQLEHLLVACSSEACAGSLTKEGWRRELLVLTPVVEKSAANSAET